MGSETGAKWFVMILLYFVCMTFIIGVVSLTMGVDVGETQDGFVTGTYCGGQRFIYEPYTGNILDTSGSTGTWNTYYSGQLDCSLSIGVLGQDICEDLSGCVWDSPGFLWWAGDDTCIGEFNNSFITTEYYLQGNILADYTLPNGESSNFICTHPTVLNDEDLCESFGCTWKYRDADTTMIDGSDIEPSLGMMSSIWETTKDVVTLRFDFGFESDLANYILYFLIFILPLIGLGMSFYVMVRS